jgi:hypothetical protein
VAALKKALRQVVDVILHSTKIRVEEIRHHEHAMPHLTLLLCVHLHRFLVLNTLTAILLLQILHSNMILLLLPNPLPPPPPPPFFFFFFFYFFFPTNAYNSLPVTNPRDPNTDFLTLLCTK